MLLFGKTKQLAKYNYQRAIKHGEKKETKYF